MADNAQLTSVLLHHVIQGRLTPDQLAGTHTTLNNDEVTIEGSGDSFTVAGEGTVTGTAGHGDLRQRADGERDRLRHRPGAQADRALTDGRWPASCAGRWPRSAPSRTPSRRRRAQDGGRRRGDPAARGAPGRRSRR